MPYSPAKIAAHTLLATICLSVAAPTSSQLFSNGRPPRPDVTLPEGPVRQVILRNCTQCHGINEYGFYAMERERWAAVVERMKTASSGVVEGMNISDDDAELLLDWLVTEFGPDATPMTRLYVIPEVTAEQRLDDAQANATLETACQDCHGPGQVKDIRLDAAQWRERLTMEVSRGAALLIQDVEPLVQWLAEAQLAEAQQ